MTDISRVKKLLGAAATLGSGSILKAIGKIAPGIGSFVSGAYTAGYAADQIADFLRDKYTTAEQKRNLGRLGKRSESGVARPDERAELVKHEQRMAPFETVAGLGKLLAQAGGGLATAKSAASAQEAERQQQEAIQNQRQEEAAFKRERELERDLESRKYKEAADKRAAEGAQRAKSSEQRAAEKHKMAMAKGQSQAKAQPKAAGTPPESYLDALRELDELINRLP